MVLAARLLRRGGCFVYGESFTVDGGVLME